MKKFIILIVSIFAFNVVYSQLDSVSIVSIQNVPLELIDSTENGIQVSNLNLEIYIDDYDFFGEVLVVVTEIESGYPISMKKFMKVDLDNNNLFNSSTKVLSLTQPIYNSTQPMQVQVVVRNFQGGHLPYLYSSINNL